MLFPSYEASRDKKREREKGGGGDNCTINILFSVSTILVTFNFFWLQRISINYMI